MKVPLQVPRCALPLITMTHGTPVTVLLFAGCKPDPAAVVVAVAAGGAAVSPDGGVVGAGVGSPLVAGAVAAGGVVALGVVIGVVLGVVTGDVVGTGRKSPYLVSTVDCHC